MNKVGDFYDAINSFAPFSTAEKWDNVGLLIGGRSLSVTRALLALDLTTAVLEEAKRIKAELVITHHPVIMDKLAALSSDSLPYKAAAAGISVISAHTNLDIAKGGVNDALACRLQLRNIRPFSKEGCSVPYRKVVVFTPTARAQEVYMAMAHVGAGMEGNYSHCAFFTRGDGRFLPLEGANPAFGEIGAIAQVEEIRLEMICPPHKLEAVLAEMKRAHPYEQPSYDVFDTHSLYRTLSLGRMGEITPTSSAQLATHVKERLGAPGVRYVDGLREIAKVAVCGGSGGGLLRAAKEAGAQALVTSDAKHHQLLEAAELGLTLIDAGHFSTENVVMEPLRLRISKRLPGAIITLSTSCTDNAKYLI